MEPVLSSSMSNSCGDSTGSNCVPWQGPDISCVPVCKPSSITPVIYGIAQVACAAQTALDLTDLDLGCLWTPTVQVWTCPPGQTFIPDTSVSVGGAPGYCGLVSPGGLIAATTAVPVPSTITNPVPRPTTLLAVLQLMIDAIPCCDPCSNRLNPGP